MKCHEWPIPCNERLMRTICSLGKKNMRHISLGGPTAVQTRCCYNATWLQYEGDYFSKVHTTSAILRNLPDWSCVTNIFKRGNRSRSFMKRRCPANTIALAYPYRPRALYIRCSNGKNGIKLTYRLPVLFEITSISRRIFFLYWTTVPFLVTIDFKSKNRAWEHLDTSLPSSPLLTEHSSPQSPTPPPLHLHTAH